MTNLRIAAAFPLTGRVTVRLDRKGRCLVRGTDLRKSSEPGVDWESDFSTLTFELDQIKAFNSASMKVFNHAAAAYKTDCEVLIRNPTNAVGGLFIRGLQARPHSCLKAAYERSTNCVGGIRDGSAAAEGRLSMNDPPTGFDARLIALRKARYKLAGKRFEVTQNEEEDIQS